VAAGAGDRELSSAALLRARLWAVITGAITAPTPMAATALDMAIAGAIVGAGCAATKPSRTSPSASADGELPPNNAVLGPMARTLGRDEQLGRRRAPVPHRFRPQGGR
jgi:hypothetical protein